MSKSIGELCEKSARLAKETISVHEEIEQYCNKIAQRLLKNPNFEFSSLPDPIVESAFYGANKPEEGWSAFLKSEIKAALKSSGDLK
jgi:hypothetical protein